MKEQGAADFHAADHPQFHSRIERQGSNVRLTTQEGNYYISYGNHTRKQKPTDIISQSSAIFLEAVGPWQKNPAGYAVGYRNLIQYADLMQSIEEAQQPLLFADLSTKDLQKIENTEFATDFSEAVIGGYVGIKSISKINKSLSRREFIKLAATSLGGAYLSLPYMSSRGRLVSNNLGIGDEVTADVKKISEQLHPEEFIITHQVRNALIAHKLSLIRNYVEGLDAIGIVIGAEHVGIESQLQSSHDERLEFIKRRMRLIRKFYEPETFARVAVCDFKDNTWNVRDNFIIRELAELY